MRINISIRAKYIMALQEFFLLSMLISSTVSVSSPHAVTHLWFGYGILLYVQRPRFINVQIKYLYYYIALSAFLLQQRQTL